MSIAAMVALHVGIVSLNLEDEEELYELEGEPHMAAPLLMQSD